jgi:signal transduction histidine kinase
MKKFIAAMLAILFFLVTSSILLATEKGTKAEAQALVKKAIAFYKANGKDRALAVFSDPKGQFVDKDLYIFVYDLNGKCLAHGFNQKMIGKDLLEMKDSEGKAYVKERVNIAKTKGKGWQDYMFTDPISKKLEHKTAYIEKVDDIIVGCGVYKT